MSVVALDWPRPKSPRPPRAVDDPQPEITTGLVIAGLFFVGLGGWATLARMDVAAYAPGVVVVSGHRQSVQSADGGVVSAIDVRDSDRVTAGQVLIRFTSAEDSAEETALATEAIDLWAQLARLDAEQRGLSAIAPPPQLVSLDPDERPLADQALAREQRTLQADEGADRARRAALADRAREADEQQVGYQRQLDANRQQRSLTDDELAGMRDLAGKGYAPMTRVRALEQSAAGLDGEAGAQSAAIGQYRTAAAEARVQAMQTDDEATKQRADERRQAEAELQQIEPKLQEARERLDRASVRAPVSGSVVGLSINTVGAVVAPGERLMEIVPDRTATVIEAKIAPPDAAGLKVGQTAKVRLPAGPDGRPLVLQAVISRLSPDVMIDPHTGQSFFIADATLPASSLANASRDQLRPGAPVEVIVPLRKRTALQYWLEPLTQSFWRSFHER